MFSDMHVKEQGLVKLRSKFALQGFHSSVSAATQSELSPIWFVRWYCDTVQVPPRYLAPFRLHPNPGLRVSTGRSMTLLLKGITRDVCFRLPDL